MNPCVDGQAGSARPAHLWRALPVAAGLPAGAAIVPPADGPYRNPDMMSFAARRNRVMVPGPGGH
ncbi:hypothetical protein ACFYYR_11670 [Streptomyces sp. NPDC001922]|uniref:hypothetical protein n=1 Tax=Streptomyces sp. NPDC001922 TaxID=3364624 RepID=UPI0036AEACB5